MPISSFYVIFIWNNIVDGYSNVCPKYFDWPLQGSNASYCWWIDDKLSAVHIAFVTATALRNLRGPFCHRLKYKLVLVTANVLVNIYKARYKYIFPSRHYRKIDIYLARIVVFVFSEVIDMVLNDIKKIAIKKTRSNTYGCILHIVYNEVDSWKKKGPRNVYTNNLVYDRKMYFKTQRHI